MGKEMTMKDVFKPLEEGMKKQAKIITDAINDKFDEQDEQLKRAQYEAEMAQKRFVNYKDKYKDTEAKLKVRERRLLSRSVATQVSFLAQTEDSDVNEEVLAILKELEDYRTKLRKVRTEINKCCNRSVIIDNIRKIIGKRGGK